MPARRPILSAAAALALVASLAPCASAQETSGAPGAGAMDVPGLPGAPQFPGDATEGGLPAPVTDATLPDGTAMDSGAPAEGVRPGTGTAKPPELLPGILDSQIKKCWAVPVMTGDPAEGGLARIRVKFLPDGRLDGPPAIIDKPAGRLGLVFAESAAAAVSKCAPYRLPPESYQSWKEIMLEFDTLDF